MTDYQRQYDSLERQRAELIDISRDLADALRNIKYICGDDEHFGKPTWNKINKALANYEKWRAE